MKNKNHRISLVALALCALAACSNEQPASKVKQNKAPKPQVQVPEFNADSAYHYIAEQVAFGPRVPNTEAHKKAGDYLESKLKNWADSLWVQTGTVQRFDGQDMAFRNFIASIHPEKSNRILLAAHWDSRYIADQDPGHEGAVEGANDGGSGVGVLMEILRQLNMQKPNIGVDIILFDVEDQGQPSNSGLNPVSHSWCLGSQYWAKNPHRPNYYAKYGILLDMVGGQHAKFRQEGISRSFAQHIVDKVWRKAHALGYSDYFLYENSPEIVDDHLYINALANIPTIDIIEHDYSTEYFFNKHWHTGQDVLENIDPASLKAVGQTVMAVVYNEQ